MPLLLDGECLLEHHPGVNMIEQDEGHVLDHMRLQQILQCRNREVVACIQLLEESLPGHLHLLQIELHELLYGHCRRDTPRP
jgi:hypothetical protein